MGSEPKVSASVIATNNVFQSEFFTILLVLFMGVSNVSCKNHDPKCHQYLYIDKSWHEVEEICRPFADSGNSHAKAMVALSLFNRADTTKEGAELLRNLYLQGNEEGVFWFVLAVFNGVIDGNYDNKELLKSLSRVGRAYELSALILQGEIYSRGWGDIPPNREEAEAKLVQACVLLEQRRTPEKDAMALYEPPPEADKYPVYLEMKKSYIEGNMLVENIEKYGFDLERIKRLAAEKLKLP